MIATPAEPAPFTTTLAVFFLLSGHTQTIDDTGQNNDGGSVLVIMKYGDIKHFISDLFLDLETARSGDVLQVDAAECRARYFLRQ